MKKIKIHRLEFFSKIKEIHPSTANYLWGYVKAKTGLYFDYEYPTVQPKIIHNNDGTQRLLLYCYTDEHLHLLRQIFEGEKVINLNGVSFVCTIKELETFVSEIGLIEELTTYKFISPALLINSRALNDFHIAGDKRAFLERMMTSQILTIGKGLNFRFEQKVTTKIISIVTQTTIQSFGLNLLGFNFLFKTNAILPDHISIGKSSVKGFGITEKIVR